MEMRCYCKTLHISYNDHVTNKDVCAKIQQATGPHKDLMVIKRCNCSGMVMFPVHQVWPSHLAKHSERGKKTRQTKEEVGGQHQEMDRPGVPQVPDGSGEQGKIEKTGCKIICGAQTTIAVKGLMMMMIRNSLSPTKLKSKPSRKTLRCL